MHAQMHTYMHMHNHMPYKVHKSPMNHYVKFIWYCVFVHILYHVPDFPRDLTLTTDSSPPLAAEEAAAPTASDGGGGKALEVESAVLKQLMGLAVNLVNEGVGFVGCQKVMHPLFKDYCREKVGVCQ